MSTLQEKQLQFNPHLVMSNDGGQLSNDSGLLLLFEFFHKIKFKELVNELLHIDDSRNYCTHDYIDLFMQVLVQLIAGYSTDSSANWLRHDPVFQQGLNKTTLGSQSMVSRFIHQLSEENIVQLQSIAKALTTIYIGQKNTQHMLIDVDSTHSDTFGKQEQTDFNTHYGTTGYHPLVAFDGLTGLFLGAELRPGNVYTSNNAEVFLADIISQHKQHSCDMFLTVRGDSGFAKPEIYELCEQEKVKYIIRLKVNARLKNMAQQKVLYGPDTDFTHKESQYFKIDYQAKSWETVRKVAVKATREAGELLFTTFEFIVSNFVDIPAQTVYKLYQKRGTMENYIKEIKHGFSFDKTDSSTFLANQARMMMSCIAYTVIHLMKELTFPDKEKKSTVATIRFKVFHIAGRLTRHARKIKVRLSTGYVFSSLFWTILENIQQLVLLH